MSIYKKLQQARDHIKGLDLEKKGYNTYSDYYYYTPEQINYLVNEACKKVGFMTKFDLIRDELGLFGKLTIIDISDNTTDLIPEIVFLQATDIPKITATNIAQQIGGSVTYTHRYLNMTVFNIVNDDLDFDTTQNTEKTAKKQSSSDKKEDEKPWLNTYTKSGGNEFTKEFVNAWKGMHEKGKTIKDIRDVYKVNKVVAMDLANETILQNDLPFE